MKQYNIPSISTIFSVASAWLVGIAVLSAATVGSASSVAESAFRIALSVALAAGSLFSFKAALSSRLSGSDEEVRREVEAALSYRWSPEESPVRGDSRRWPLETRGEANGKARAA